MRRTRPTSGFTLIEIIVVMSIAAAVVAITIPAAQSLSQGNRATTCVTQMQRIGQALKLYALDEGSVPAFYPGMHDPASGLDELLPEVDDEDGWVEEKIRRSGLLRLVDTGYLGNEATLNCPADFEHRLGHPLYAYSYMVRDEEAESVSGPYVDYNQHKYLSCRGISRDAADPDVRRQLSPLPPTATGELVPEISRGWHPDDTTLVTWCEHHHHAIRQNREGQYMALFWDGSARRIPGYVFRGGGPVDAWRVRPSDAVMP